MSLAEKLDVLREGSASRIPEDKRAIMAKATADLRASDIINWVPKVGDTLPEFSLQNAHGVDVHAADLLAQGPLVLSVFRGTW